MGVSSAGLVTSRRSRRRRRSLVVGGWVRRAGGLDTDDNADDGQGETDDGERIDLLLLEELVDHGCSP